VVELVEIQPRLATAVPRLVQPVVPLGQMVPPDRGRSAQVVVLVVLSQLARPPVTGAEGAVRLPEVPLVLEVPVLALPVGLGLPQRPMVPVVAVVVQVLSTQQEARVVRVAPVARVF
jgi:hypothetical protein